MKFQIKYLLLLGLFSFSLMAEERDDRAYVEQYKFIAIKKMQEFGIPASITLAQGILESAAGTSYLARNANNHFGIKCHDWTGKKIYRDDDKANECFRKYASPEESFNDHSLFLKNRSRYAFLFELEPTDYKGWAHGLKKAGYATNPKYPQLLIDLIERYELYLYDDPGYYMQLADADVSLAGHTVMQHPNKLKFVLAREDDSFESIAEANNIKIDRLLEYNDLTYEARLEPGQVIFLSRKKRKAKEKFYTAQSGDEMWDIAQKHGMRLKYLYKKNQMKVGEQPETGQKMWLRRTKGKKFLGIF